MDSEAEIQFEPSTVEREWAVTQLGLPVSASPDEVDAAYFAGLSANQFVPYEEMQEAYAVLRGEAASFGFRRHENELAEQQVSQFVDAIGKTEQAGLVDRYHTLIKSLPEHSRARDQLRSIGPAVLGENRYSQYADPKMKMLVEGCMAALKMRRVDRLVFADELRTRENLSVSEWRSLAKRLVARQRGLAEATGDFLAGLTKSKEVQQTAPTHRAIPPVIDRSRLRRQIPHPRRGQRDMSNRLIGVAIAVGIAIVAFVVGFLPGITKSPSPPPGNVNFQIPKRYGYPSVPSDQYRAPLDDFKYSPPGNRNFILRDENGKPLDLKSMTQKEVESWAKQSAEEWMRQRKKARKEAAERIQEELYRQPKGAEVFDPVGTPARSPLDPFRSR